MAVHAKLINGIEPPSDHILDRSLRVLMWSCFAGANCRPNVFLKESYGVI